MKCDKCHKEFKSEDLHESHDIPCYLFEGNKKGRKNQADRFPRHWLCKKKGIKGEEFCHDKYEKLLREYLRYYALKFAMEYFKEEDDTNTTSETRI